jgi:pimeloyl-ACP methyl ester carboxylesterase
MKLITLYYVEFTAMESQYFDKINYSITGAGAKTVVFLHGNSLDSETFILQTTGKFQQHFRIITVDLPGHGKSPRADHPADEYSFPGLINTLTIFLKNYVETDFILAGHSFGGHLALECLPTIKHFKGLVIWGTPPLTGLADLQLQFLPHPDVMLAYKNVLTDIELQKLTRVFIPQDSQYYELVRKAISLADGNFREIIGQSLMKEEFRNEKEIIESMDIPVAIFHGAQDNLINFEYLNSLKVKNLWKKRIHSIRNAGHCSHIEQSGIFNSLLVDFVNEIS